jgi:hypothetical protein
LRTSNRLADTGPQVHLLPHPTCCVVCGEPGLVVDRTQSGVVRPPSSPTAEDGPRFPRALQRRRPDVERPNPLAHSTGRPRGEVCAQMRERGRVGVVGVVGGGGGNLAVA